MYNLYIEWKDEDGIQNEDWLNISWYKVRSIVDEWMNDSVTRIVVNKVE